MLRMCTKHFWAQIQKPTTKARRGPLAEVLEVGVPAELVTVLVVLQSTDFDELVHQLGQ